MMRFPKYARLKYEIDKPAILDEIAQFRPYMKTSAPRQYWIDNAYALFGAVNNRTIPPELMDRVYVRDHNNGDPVVMHGDIPSWYALNVRYVRDDDRSRFDGYNYRHDLSADWVWDDRVDIPATRAAVEGLPFDVITMVRLLHLPAGGVGPAHVDDDPRNNPYGGEFTSVSFNVKLGGPGMTVFIDGEVFEVSDDVFVFADEHLHGVGQVQEDRWLLRIHGKPSERFHEIITEGAIW